MARTNLQLTAELARHHFAYDTESGSLTWRQPRAKRVKAGDMAGSVTHQGYREVRVLGRQYSAHRIAWLMHYGVWPSIVDHINCVRDDNRIENLREVTRGGNCQNTRSAQKCNRTGLLGATFHKASGKFRARIHIPNGKQRHLGLFDTAEEAHAAYVVAKRQFHSACTI